MSLFPPASSFLPSLMVGTSFLGGLAKKRAAQMSAQSEEEAAIATKVRGYFQARGMKLDQEVLLSTIRNRTAGAGLDVTQGSPLEAYLQTARETELDILHTRSTAEREANEHLRRAAALRTGGDMELYGSLLSGAKDALKYKADLDRVSFKA